MDVVSIIIPVHKTIPYFKECVDSVLTQTHQHLDIIIACNGSLEIADCKRYLNIHDDRVVYIKTPTGRSRARNAGLKAAQGDFIQFLDYDDVLFPEKLSSQLSAMRATGSQVSICQWKKFRLLTTEFYRFPFEGLFVSNKATSLEIIDRLGFSGGFIATAAYVFHRDIAMLSTWIDSPNDDAVYFSKICKQNPQISLVRETLVGYRMHDDNNSTIDSIQQFELLLHGWVLIEDNLSISSSKGQKAYFFKAYRHLLLISTTLKNYKKRYLVLKCLKYARTWKDLKSVLRSVITPLA